MYSCLKHKTSICSHNYTHDYKIGYLPIHILIAIIESINNEDAIRIGMANVLDDTESS